MQNMEEGKPNQYLSSFYCRNLTATIALCFMLNSFSLYGNTFDASLHIQEKTSIEVNYQKAQSFFKEGKSSEALKLALLVLEDAKKERDNTYLEKSYFLLGCIFEKSTNYQKALTYFNRALGYAKELNDVERITENQLKIGKTYVFLNKLNSAEISFNKVIAVKSNSTIIQTIQAHAYVNLSGIFFKKDADLEKGQQYALKAIQIYKEYNNAMFQAYAYTNLASNYYVKQKYLDAKKYYLEALVILQNNEANKEIQLRETLYENLGWTLRNLNDPKGFDYINKSSLLRDSLQKASYRKELLDIEAKHNVVIAQKEKEKAQSLSYFLGILSAILLTIAIILYRNIQLKQKNKIQSRILNATIDKKEAQEKEITDTIHDELISMMSTADFYLSMVGAKINEEPYEEMATTKELLANFSNKLKDLSNTIIPSELLIIGIPDAVKNLCEKYSSKSLSLKSEFINLSEYSQSFQLKVYRIVFELISNIVMHSNASKASIVLEEKKEKLIITAKDNGKGFNAKKVKEQQQGIGLAQIEVRIKKMKGAFKIHSANGNGTNISINIPIAIQG